MREEVRKRRSRAAVAFLFASLAILASITRLHGTPAFLSEAAGGALIVVGIVLLSKR